MKWNKWRPWKANGRGESLSGLRTIAADPDSSWAMNGDTLVVVADDGDGNKTAFECRVIRTCTSVRVKS